MKRFCSRWIPIGCVAALVIGCSDSTGPGLDTLRITTESLPNAVVGQVYTEGITASGGDAEYEWEVLSGSLPPGLDLSVEDVPENDAIVSGTPDDETTATFRVQVRSGDGQTATEEFTIQVFTDPIENVALPPALVGAPYSVPLRMASDAPDDASWEIEGSLPPGLSLVDGRIEGTPTATDTAELTVRLESDAFVSVRMFELRAVADFEDRYNITPFEVVEVPDDLRPYLDAAVARWEAAISGDLGPIAFTASGSGQSQLCGGFRDEVGGTAVDDLLLIVNIGPIDGTGGEEDVLGRGGPCLIRNSTLLSAAGSLTLDSENLRALTATAAGRETVQDIIIHEIGHVLGFGTLWGEDLLNLVEGSGTNDPRFTGQEAVAEWQALSGESTNVPLEAGGGEGTVESHWREFTFDNELMTGFIEQVGRSNPLSRLTIASLADLGYTVDADAADTYALPQSLLAQGSPARRGHLGRDVADPGPIQVIDDRGWSGRVLRTVRPEGSR